MKRYKPSVQPEPWTETVKQARLDGGVDDTFKTEAEHAGYRARQGRLELPTMGCNCWVREETAEERFAIRAGAHCPSCYTFASSRDPVDQAHDQELHAERCQDEGYLLDNPTHAPDGTTTEEEEG